MRRRKANLSQPQKRLNARKTKNEKAFPLKDNKMPINQQLKLILKNWTSRKRQTSELLVDLID